MPDPNFRKAYDLWYFDKEQGREIRIDVVEFDFATGKIKLNGVEREPETLDRILTLEAIGQFMRSISNGRPDTPTNN